MSATPTTNVPLPQFTAAGLVTPSEQAVLNGVMADWQAAFSSVGKTMNTQLATLQGQTISSESFMISAFFGALSQLIAQVDPATATGAFQDALGRIYFLTRQLAVNASIPSVVIAGVPGQTLAAGALAISQTDNSQWVTSAPATFDPTTGLATVTFVAVQSGAGPVCLPNALKQGQSSTVWQGINSNPGSIAGVNVESAQSFEQRRQASVTIGGVGQAANVMAAVLAVSGVTDAFVYNNGSPASILYGSTNYPIPANSIAVSVSGTATPAAIGAAILSKLDCGCGTSTNAGLGSLQTVTVTDNSGLYVAPLPQYQYRYVVPAPTEVYFNVQIANLPNIPATYVAQIQQAIVSAFVNGFATEDGTISLSRARIGGQIIGAAFKPCVAVLNSQIIPVNIFVGLSATPTTESVTLGIDQQPAIAALNITVSQISV